MLSRSCAGAGGRFKIGSVSADAAWRRVDRTLDEVRARLVDADTEEQFQGSGIGGGVALLVLVTSALLR